MSNDLGVSYLDRHELANAAPDDDADGLADKPQGEAVPAAGRVQGAGLGATTEATDDGSFLGKVRKLSYRAIGSLLGGQGDTAGAGAQEDGRAATNAEDAGKAEFEMQEMKEFKNRVNINQDLTEEWMEVLKNAAKKKV